MGSDVHAIVVGDAGLLERARMRIEELERRWSRFIPDSEISVLNARRGVPHRVSDDTLALVLRAVQAWRATGGRFDPTVLGDVIRAGYDRPFEGFVIRRDGGVSALRRDAGGIVIDPVAQTVALPEHAGFDPGGIGKGLAADLVATELVSLGAAGVCVNLGGDLRVAGVSPHGDAAWLVAVRDAPDDEPIAHVAVADGGVATTSRTRRRWTTADGIERHHVIDPGTGRSARTPVLHATAIARDAWRAEVLSTVAFLDGVAGIEFAERLGATAMIATADGVTAGAGWTRYEYEPAIPQPARS